MSDRDKYSEFSIDNLETLSIKQNWCSWCVHVYVGDAQGDWSSCGTGLLSFYGKKRSESQFTKLSSVKELKAEENVWEPGMFTLQVRQKKNLANNNRSVQIDPELRRRLSMNGSPDTLLHCELKKSVQCNLSELVLMWYQEDYGEHLALSFLSAVTIIESWYFKL